MSATGCWARPVPDASSETTTPASMAARRTVTVRLPGVERQVQGEHVHPGLAQHAEEAPFGVLLDEFAYLRGVELALAGHPRDLVERGRRADVRIEAAARGG